MDKIRHCRLASDAAADAPSKRYNRCVSQGTSTTIIDDGESSGAGRRCVKTPRESASAADLSKLDKFGLEPALSRRVASFADDFNAGHAEDSLVRSLLRHYATAASQVRGDAAATTELRRDAVLRIDLLKHDKRLIETLRLPPGPARAPADADAPWRVKTGTKRGEDGKGRA